MGWVYVNRTKPEHKCKRPYLRGSKDKTRFDEGSIWKCRKCGESYKTHWEIRNVLLGWQNFWEKTY